MDQSIFAEGRFRQSVAAHEFRYFRKMAISDIKSICESIDRFKSVEREFHFWTDKENGEEHLQFNFGLRSMFRKNDEGKAIFEKGPALVYSLAPTGGYVAISLYPAKSELGTAAEDHLFLRIGTYSGYQLRKRLRGDIEDLVSYVFVTSLETTPTIRDRIRIGWLRRTHPHQLDGKFVRPLSAGGVLTSASKFTATTMFIAFLRPLGVIVAYALLAYLGYTNLVPHLQ